MALLILENTMRQARLNLILAGEAKLLRIMVVLHLTFLTAITALLWSL